MRGKVDVDNFESKEAVFVGLGGKLCVTFSCVSAMNKFSKWVN